MQSAGSTKVPRTRPASARMALSSPRGGLIEHQTISSIVTEEQLLQLFNKYLTNESKGANAFVSKDSHEWEQKLTMASEWRRRMPSAASGLDRTALGAMLADIHSRIEIPEADRLAAARRWLKELDIDGNGTVEWHELLKWFHADGGSYSVNVGRMTAAAASERLAVARSMWLPRTPPRPPRDWNVERGNACRTSVSMLAATARGSPAAAFAPRNRLQPSRPGSAPARSVPPRHRARAPRWTAQERRGLETGVWTGLREPPPHPPPPQPPASPKQNRPRSARAATAAFKRSARSDERDEPERPHEKEHDQKQNKARAPHRAAPLRVSYRMAPQMVAEPPAASSEADDSRCKYVHGG